MAANPSGPTLPRPPAPRPGRATGHGWVLSVGVVLLIGLACVWLLAYFVLGVNPAFIIGLIRAVVSPPRTASDVTAPADVKVAVWAKGLANPTSLAFGPDGRLYVADFGAGTIYRFGE